MKKIISILSLFALVAVFGVSASAETKTLDGYVFRLKATRDGSDYKKGEIVEFLLTAEKDGKPVDKLTLTGEITNDTIAMRGKFSGEIKDGKFTVSEKLDKEGFLKCSINVFVADKDGKKHRVNLLAGAAVSPFEIKPSSPAPADFDAFWESQKELLKNTPMNLKITPVKSGSADVELFDIQADIPQGILTAYLAIPKGAKPKSLPALVTTQGAGVRSSGKKIGEAKRGFIALDFNVHGLPNGKEKSFYDNLAKTELRNYRIFGMGDKDKVYFKKIYLRLMRAMDIVMARPEWDGKNLMIYGGSQGGGQALAAAGLYPDKVSAICAMFPAICDHTGFVVNRTSGWPHFTKALKGKVPTLADVDGARYIDAVNFSSRIKCPVVYMINYADDVCEPTSCYAAYNNISAPKELFINEESRHNPAKGTPSKVFNMMLKNLKK